jgi:hypothetical protein
LFQVPSVVVPMEAVMGETGEGSKEGSDSNVNKAGTGHM